MYEIHGTSYTKWRPANRYIIKDVSDKLTASMFEAEAPDCKYFAISQDCQVAEKIRFVAPTDNFEDCSITVVKVLC